MLGRLKIVIPSFNSVKYLPKTLHSIETQTFKAYDVCIVDDASTIPQQRQIIEEFCQRHSSWRALFHSHNQGALVSIIDGINGLDCQDEDVIVIIDGDDWLANDQALQIIADTYQSPDVYLTYGSFETYPKDCINITYAAPIGEEVIEKQLYRHIRWVFHHPKTFKYFLWKQVKDEDLRNGEGNYYMVTSDRALFYPLLEMAGRHIRFIDKILYIYNLENPLNDHKINRDEQYFEELYIKSRTKYPPLR
ncbi:glycosyltransferase family 2 protein [Candidatus Protochlamydia phocaeensis]|uniref:glycosyltransferase family 2 protein n=1 Tax=Candidatus Protochlamydia phocaeensis TaxID=1414722 RepID=UPI0008399813|nr:glycosyltransferase family A protein [Candidatus Protochlamydia phocaeensis]